MYVHLNYFFSCRMMVHTKHHVESDQKYEAESQTTCQHCFRNFPSPLSLQSHVERVHSQAESSSKYPLTTTIIIIQIIIIHHIYIVLFKVLIRRLCHDNMMITIQQFCIIVKLKMFCCTENYGRNISAE